MRSGKSHFVGASLSALFIGALVAQDAPPPKETPLAPATNPAEIVDPAKRAALDEVLKNLGAEDFAARNAAQKKLAGLGSDFAPAIREAMSKTEDGELKQRLQLALDGLAESDALNPPRLSLDLKDASFSDIAKALSKATGKNIEAASAGATPVTLKVENKTFWETIAAINAVAALDVKDTAYDRKFVLDPQKAVAGSYKQASLSGGFAFFPGPVEHATDGYTFTMRSAIDPRVTVLKQGRVTLTEMLDDAGNSLAPKSEETPLYESQGAVSTTMIRIKEPVKASKKVVSIKGTVRYLVLVAADTLEVPDLSKAVDPITLDGFQIKFTEAKLADGKPKVAYITETPAGKPLVALRNPQEALNPEFEIRDADGKFIYRIRVSGGGGGAMTWGGVDKFTEPFKGRFIIPLHTKEVTVPFEFKDLPMP